jgi:hypothetical protein
MARTMSREPLPSTQSSSATWMTRHCCLSSYAAVARTARRRHRPQGGTLGRVASTPPTWEPYLPALTPGPAATSDRPTHTDLIRGTDWPPRARFLYGFFAYPLTALIVGGSLFRGNPAVTELALIAVCLLIILICEWRLRRMGFRVDPGGIELVRALNTTRVAWGQIECFRAIERGWYGSRYVFVKRRGVHLDLPVPTVALLRSAWPLRRPEPGLRWSGGGTDDSVGFLQRQLEIYGTDMAQR